MVAFLRRWAVDGGRLEIRRDTLLIAARSELDKTPLTAAYKVGSIIAENLAA